MLMMIIFLNNFLDKLLEVSDLVQCCAISGFGKFQKWIIFDEEY